MTYRGQASTNEEVRRRQARIRQARRRRAQVRRRRLTLLTFGLLLILVLIIAIKLPKMEGDSQQQAMARVPENTSLPDNTAEETVQGIAASVFSAHPEWTEDYLSISEWNRPGEPLNTVKNIFVHYTANPNTSAAQNRSYFESLSENHETAASAHFIIGYNGEILQIIPLDEIGYAVKTRNEDSISIECCYKSENGQFTQETYDALIELLAWLCEAYDLDPEEDILRHYDCGGKKCPLYYVEHPDAWSILKSDVADSLTDLHTL